MVRGGVKENPVWDALTNSGNPALTMINVEIRYGNVLRSFSSTPLNCYSSESFVEGSGKE